MCPSISVRMCLAVVLAVGGSHAAAQETATLTKIRSAGSVTLGHSEQQVPFAYLGWKKASNLKTLADLEGKTVAAQAGTTNLAVLNQVNTQCSLKMVVKSFRTTVDLLSALDSGDVAAIASDDVLLQGIFAQTTTPQAYALSAEALSVEPYGMMYRKDDPAFKEVVQNAVSALMASGGLERIYEKWFTQPIPPRGVNFAAPMEDMLKQAIARPTNSPVPADYRQVW